MALYSYPQGPSWESLERGVNRAKDEMAEALLRQNEFYSRVKERPPEITYNPKTASYHVQRELSMTQEQFAGYIGKKPVGYCRRCGYSREDAGSMLCESCLQFEKLGMIKEKWPKQYVPFKGQDESVDSKIAKRNKNIRILFWHRYMKTGKFPFQVKELETIS